MSMTFLQFAIGALNDIIDAPADAGRQPPKAIPAGLVTIDQVRILVVLCAVVGCGFASASGPAALAVAVAVLGIGFGYDLLAKGTQWSWLPFAIGIPLLPVYGWLGVTGTLPAAFAILLPMAFLAGAGLAIANARSDLEADRRSGTRSVATALGPRRSWWAGVALMAAATGIGLVATRPGGWSPPTVGLVAAGTAVVAIGLLVGVAQAAVTRRRAWELQAMGAAIAATGWVGGLLRGP
jgi:4-hydroxybenzoate polyprenyltransferase